MTMRSSRAALFAASLALLIAPSAFAQQKPAQPKIVIVAKGPRSEPKPSSASGGATFVHLTPFGATCKPTSDDKSAYASRQPISIQDAAGAPIAEIRITSYGDDWKSDEEIRARILRVLSAQATDLSPGIDWDESTFIDLVGKVRFKDGKESPFEESGGHVCFSNHEGAVIFTRVQLPK
jgi:hypothetical protein